jgi:hypothetical protein
MRLTKNFSLEELLVSEIAGRNGIDNTPPGAFLPRLELLATSLERVREILERPIIVTSGYRCLELNRRIGSRDNSAHVQGFAVDFISPQFGSPAAICRALEQRADLDFDQLILEHDWVHWSIMPGLRRQLLTLREDGGYDLGIIGRSAS